MSLKQRLTVHVWPSTPSAAWLPCSSVMDVALHPFCLFRSKLLDLFFPCSAIGVQMYNLDDRIIRAKSPNKTRSKYIAILWDLTSLLCNQAETLHLRSFPWTQTPIVKAWLKSVIIIRHYKTSFLKKKNYWLFHNMWPSRESLYLIFITAY